MPKPDYLKTWRSINQAGGPTELVRSHFLQPQAKIERTNVGKNPDTGKLIFPRKEVAELKDTPSIPDVEPTSGNFAELLGRLPGADIAKDWATDPLTYLPGGAEAKGVGKAISWFGTKAAREKSGENLIKLLRSRHAEGTPMRDAVEKAYTNYPRTFAHISDIDQNVGGRLHRGTHFPEWGAEMKFMDVPIHDVHGDPVGTVPKLKNTRQGRLTDEDAMDEFIKGNAFQNPREQAINNRVAIRPDVIGTPQGEITFRHELGHVAQNIRNPKTHIADIEAGRGQISGLHDSGTDLPSLDYRLEPVEVGARVGQERGLNKGRVREAIDPYVGYDSTKPVSYNSKISHKKHSDIINAEIERVINDYKIKTGYAKETPLYQENYGAVAGGGKGKKVYPSKGDLAKSEPKVLAAAFKKINDQVLPHFNKARPASDPLVFTLNGTVIPKIEGMLKNPEKLGDFIRDIRVSRLSQVKK